ncbi:MAG: hypothetical protein ACKO8I_07320 [Cyanobacteriota bacterium]
MANPSISISLEEGLLAQLDGQGSNRSALVSEALVQWLARSRIDALNAAYAHLASSDSGDLADAGDAAVAMGLAALATIGLRRSAAGADRTADLCRDHGDRRHRDPSS